MSARIVQTLGEHAADRVAEDPWCVLEVPGVAPQAADALARVALEHAEPGDPRRSRALIGWLLGSWADRAWHQGWIGIAGIVLGAVAGFVQIFRTAAGYLKNGRNG